MTTQPRRPATGFSSLVRIANAPGALIARSSGIFVVSFLALALFSMWRRPGVFSAILVVVAAVATIAVSVFAWRRDRLSKLVDEAENRVGSGAYGDGVLTLPESPAGPDDVEERLQQMLDFEQERSLRRDTWMPGIEATQRALVRAAGGVENAPYLRDDLRVTLISLLATVAAIPVSALGIFFSLLQIFG